MVEIQSNGSKWLGQEPDNIEVLLEVLAKEPLDKTFEDYGNFYEPLEDAFCQRCGYPLGTINFFGNFFKLSHVFNIRTDELKLIHKLVDAIELNKLTPAYKEQ